MKLEQIAIYDSIEGYMEQIPVIKVKKVSILRNDVHPGMGHRTNITY